MRGWRHIGPVGLLLAGLACGRSSAGEFDTTDLRGPQVTPPLEKPDLLLHDTEGKRFNLKQETAGRLTLLLFGYTRCPDVCPVHLANIARALGSLPSAEQARVAVVFVTVDPRRDTPAELRSYLDRFDHRFIGLTGDSASIAWVFTQLRLNHPMEPVQAGQEVYTIAHNALVLAFTRDNLAHVAYPFGMTPDDWRHDLARLAKD